MRMLSVAGYGMEFWLCETSSDLILQHIYYIITITSSLHHQFLVVTDRSKETVVKQMPGNVLQK